MRWGGLIIVEEEWTPLRFRPRSTTRYDERHFLVTPVDEPAELDELFNSSCDSNSWLLDAITVSARRAIRPGEEITVDAALWNDDDYVFTEVCRCGTALCRGTITGKDWLRPELQARYQGHFLPHLNRMIAAQSGS